MHKECGQNIIRDASMNEITSKLRCKNCGQTFRYLHSALTVVLDVVRMPPVGGGGGGGAPDALLLFMECEFVSGTNGRAKNRSRSCIYAFIKISNFSSISATYEGRTLIIMTTTMPSSDHFLYSQIVLL